MVRLLLLFLAAAMCAASLQGMPVAVISPSTLTVVCGQPIVFGVTGSHGTDAHVIVDYRWEFPSGESLSGSQVSCVFPTHGVHRVELWITDASGRSAIVEVSITIQQGGPPAVAPGTPSEARAWPFTWPRERPRPARSRARRVCPSRPRRFGWSAAPRG